MRHKALVILTTCLAMFTGCGEEEVFVPEPTPPPKHTQQSTYAWDGKLFTELTPVTAFELQGDTLQIFPYFDADNYINVKRIFKSSNGFWETTIAPYEETDNYIDAGGYSLVSMDNHYTYGWIDIDEEQAYLVSTTTLSSAYVREVCEQLCQQDT